MINKIRFIEPGNCSPYKKSLVNLYTYNKYIRNPSTGLITLTTIVKDIVNDTLMYSESISKINFKDVFDSDIVFIGINTFNAMRGYEIARLLKKESKALVVIGGLHATLNYPEAIEYCDYVLLGEGDDLIKEFIEAVDNEKSIDMPGVVYKNADEIIHTGKRQPPENINTIPNRNLVYNYKKMAKLNTLWP